MTLIIFSGEVIEMLRSEDLIIAESIMQNGGFTAIQGKQAHSRLRNCLSNAAVELKGKPELSIIGISFLSWFGQKD